MHFEGANLVFLEIIIWEACKKELGSNIKPPLYIDALIP